MNQERRPNRPEPRRPGSLRVPSRGPAVPVVLLPCCALLALVAGARPDARVAEGVDDTRAALEKWVETRRIVSQERRDWALGKELLQDRIGLVQSETDSLRSKIDDARESIADADRKRADLVAENERFASTSGALTEVVTALEERTRELLPRLPEPIRERIKPLSQRLPDPAVETKASLSERFQNVVGVLNEIDKFQREITVTSEVRALPDGTSAEVTALYVGVGHGYYVGADGRTAGVGTASADGWTWSSDDAVAAEIAAAVSIFKNEEGARFVQLPVRIE